MMDYILSSEGRRGNETRLSEVIGRFSNLLSMHTNPSSTPSHRYTAYVDSYTHACFPYDILSSYYANVFGPVVDATK